MASSEKSAGAGASSTLSNVFTGTAWTGTGNIVSSNNVYATVNLDGTNTSSQSLLATNFGFDFNINGLATINGIVVSFERKASLASRIKDNAIYLLKNGAHHGNNKSAGAYWSTTEGTVSFGSPSDLWGSSLLPEDIRADNFGVMIQVAYQNAYSNTTTAYIDHVKITVHYTAPAIYYGTTPVGRIFIGSTEVRKVAYGSSLLSTS
jgi:hypothetical protein